MGKYVYTKCSKCNGDKNADYNNYCKKCQCEYTKYNRLKKMLKPNVDMFGLGYFIMKVKTRDYYVSMEDINTIIFFYEIITNNIHEYDKYSGAKQIKRMWNRLLKYQEVYNKSF